MGNTEIKREEYFISKYNFSKSDILKIEYHGSRNSNSDILLTVLKMKNALMPA